MATTAEVIARYADSRPGMALVDYAEVGLPTWRVLARCDVLEPKPISTIDEITMRAVSLGVDDPLELQIMLGLDEQVLDPTLTELVNREWARDADEDGAIALTEGGEEILAAACEIVARELVVPFDYDGLLRRPILDQRLLDRRAGLGRGMREVPATPERPPEVGELRSCRQSIGRILRDAGGRRAQETQLLDVRSIDRRDRYMLPAMALVFAPLGRGRCEVALVIDEDLSVEHEAAFVNAALADRIGLDRMLRATPRRALAFPRSLPPHIKLDEDGERKARAAVGLATERLSNSDEGASQNELREHLQSARAVLNGLSVRTVLPHEHEALMRLAMNSRRRLLIAGGAVTGTHVNGIFIKRLREMLASGVLVRLVISGAAAGSEDALDRLKKVASDFPTLVIDEREAGDEGVLICDDRFVAFGAFSWLGHLGDRERPLTDVRSVLVRSPDVINGEWSRLDGRDGAAGSDQPSRPRRRSRSRPRKPRP